MAKIKVKGRRLDQNLIGGNFLNTASQTIFSFGRFRVTTNFEGREVVDYTTKLGSFVEPITLNRLNINDLESEILRKKRNEVDLNLDRTNLNTYVKFGSAREFLRVSMQNVIDSFPGSVFVNPYNEVGGNITFYDFSYDNVTNISKFKIPSEYTENPFNLIFNRGNEAIPNDNELKNINLSYDQYVIWTKKLPHAHNFNLVGFTGDTDQNPNLHIAVEGNPFPHLNEGETQDEIVLHIKPRIKYFELFRDQLSNYEKNIVGNRDGLDGFEFTLKEPILLEDGTIRYSDRTLLWNTTDGYNLDVNGPTFERFIDSVAIIGEKYDNIKTDLIARFLTPQSIKTYDLTTEGKIGKLLRLYGSEFDKIRQFIDSLATINKVTYDKKNNIPDQIISNLARTLGWEYSNLVNEEELMVSLLSVDDDEERSLTNDLLPAEVDIELWRRILINTNYFWKSKGTRESIKAMLLMIGIPEPFINITEYVYTVDGKINPNEVTLQIEDIPSASFPFDSEGYPIAPKETNDFYFQISGNTDSGQAYMNNFRNVGFDLNRVVDNKKSWIATGATIRDHYTTNQYYQEDSKLVLNTKEIDIALDLVRGVEYDVYKYVELFDYPANTTGYTMPFSFVNLSLKYDPFVNVSTFQLPFSIDDEDNMGDVEVRYNGLLLNAQRGPVVSGITGDYTITGNTLVINNSAFDDTNRRDVIQVTRLFQKGEPISGVSVNYVVERMNVNASGTKITLPQLLQGDIQLSVSGTENEFGGGIVLTKNTPDFAGDYYVEDNIVTITNPAVIAHLDQNNGGRPYAQVAYIEVSGSTSIETKSEVIKITSFNTNKLQYSPTLNRHIYRLNYKANKTSDLKILVNGIALEVGKDYNLNSLNKFEVYVLANLKYGDVVSVYYIVGGEEFDNPLIPADFGLGDITKLSYLEFIELIERRLINATNRKVISDFSGGWYPSLLHLYLRYYYERGELSDDNPMKSNAYSFINLYPFLSKYNAFFKRFVDQLLSATVIMRKSGLLVRNSVFRTQKFAYKRGVNTSETLNYFGTDGALLKRIQPIIPITTTTTTSVPTTTTTTTEQVFSIQTITGNTGPGSILNTGGYNIEGGETANIYYMQYSKDGFLWIQYPEQPFTGPVGESFNVNITGLDENTLYYYRAVYENDEVTPPIWGDTLQITTGEDIGEPTITTKQFTELDNQTSAFSIKTGGNIIDDGGQTITNYGILWVLTTDSTPPGDFTTGNTSLNTIDTSGDPGNDYVTNIVSSIVYPKYLHARAFIKYAGNTTYGQIISSLVEEPVVPLVELGFGSIDTDEPANPDNTIKRSNLGGFSNIPNGGAVTLKFEGTLSYTPNTYDYGVEAHVEYRTSPTGSWIQAYYQFNSGSVEFNIPITGDFDNSSYVDVRGRIEAVSGSSDEAKLEIRGIEINITEGVGTFTAEFNQGLDEGFDVNYPDA